ELGRAEEVHRIGTRGLADLQHLVADLVDGLIPGNALPLTGNELHRVLETPLAMRVLARGSALRTVRTEIERAVEPGLLPDPHAVLHLGENRAAHGTVRTDRLPDLDIVAARIRRLSLGLLNTTGDERRCRCQTADGQPRIAQECAPVDRPVRFDVEGRRQAGPPCGSVRLLPQHNLLPLNVMRSARPSPRAADAGVEVRTWRARSSA